MKFSAQSALFTLTTLGIFLTQSGGAEPYRFLSTDSGFETLERNDPGVIRAGVHENGDGRYWTEGDFYANKDVVDRELRKVLGNGKDQKEVIGWINDLCTLQNDFHFDKHQYPTRESFHAFIKDRIYFLQRLLTAKRIASEALSITNDNRDDIVNFFVNINFTDE